MIDVHCMTGPGRRAPTALRPMSTPC